MRKLITLALLTFFIPKMNAQVFVEGTNINELPITYCEIVGTAKLISKKVTVSIDYGQERKFFSNNQRVTDTTGKDVVFNSMMDAINFMYNNGWEFVTAYAITMNNSNVYHHLLKKKTEK